MGQSRGLRNNNPGNIRRSASVTYCGEIKGADAEFRTFEAMRWGYRAIFVVLHTYRLRYGIRTIGEAIGRWAPPEENNTSAYIEFVVRQSGRSASEPYDTLSAEDMVPIVEAISRMENGVSAVTEDVAEGWRLFCKDYKR